MRMYQPSMLVVGSRNKTKYKHAYSGAGIFKYRLKHSTIPVVIVRDKLQKRRQPDNKEPSASSISLDLVKQDNHHQQHVKLENQCLSKRVRKTLAIFSCT